MKVRVMDDNCIIISNMMMMMLYHNMMYHNMYHNMMMMMISGEFSYGGFSCSYILCSYFGWVYAIVMKTTMTKMMIQ